jgi:site-specific DNA recombinase
VATRHLGPIEVERIFLYEENPRHEPIETEPEIIEHHVNMTISLAFLAPNLVKAAVEGRLPRGIGIERLRDPPTEWSRQFESLGLNPE